MGLAFKSFTLVFSLLLGSANLHANDCVRKTFQKFLASNIELKVISGATNTGPRIQVTTGHGGRKLEEIKEFSIAQLNMENLVEVTRKGKKPLDTVYSIAPNAKRAEPYVPELAKPESKLKSLASSINKADPDVLVVQEVGGMVSLDHFNRKYLDGKYRSVLIPAKEVGLNEPVNFINIGFLVKRDLPFDLELQSFRNVSSLTRDVKLFSRDLPLLILKERNGRPRMAIFGTHFKAMSDPVSTAIRIEQVEVASQIIKAYSSRYENLPIFLVGDYNLDILRGAEYEILRKTAGMEDAFNLTGKRLADGDRMTHYGFNKDKKPRFKQYDSVSSNKVTQEFSLIKSAEISPYYDEAGNILAKPTTKAEAKELPSDHAMIKVTVDFQKLLKIPE